MTIARVEGGEVLEFRALAMSAIPEHKRSLWRPVVEEGAGSLKVVTVESDRVLIVRSDPVHLPQIISDRQFFQQLAHIGVITNDEALAAVGPGNIPHAMEALISAMPEADRFAARMLLTGATQFDRQHPLVAAFATGFDWSASNIDAFWTDAAQL